MDWRMSFVVIFASARWSKAALLKAVTMDIGQASKQEKSSHDRLGAPCRKCPPRRIYNLFPYKSHEVELGIILVCFCTRI